MNSFPQAGFELCRKDLAQGLSSGSAHFCGFTIAGSSAALPFRKPSGKPCPCPAGRTKTTCLARYIGPFPLPYADLPLEDTALQARQPRTGAQGLGHWPSGPPLGLGTDKQNKKEAHKHPLENRREVIHLRSPQEALTNGITI